jgi:hypothetical protein
MHAFSPKVRRAYSENAGIFQRLRATYLSKSSFLCTRPSGNFHDSSGAAIEAQTGGFSR